MPTKANKPWDERRNDLLGDVIQLTYELSEGKVPHVHSDITFVYVHFFAAGGKDIGNLTLGTALHALWNDVFMWSESSTEENEHGEPAADLNIKKAKKKAKKPETVKVMPDFTPDQAKKLDEAVNAKQHAEYLCFMMLNRLNRAVPLEQLLKDAVRRETCDGVVIEEFFGQGEDAGCCEAEGFTLPKLLEHWQECTDNMLRIVVEAGRNNRD